MSFGGDTVDNLGIVRDFPARSAVTGLIGNALGWDRTQGALLDRLQRRLVMGSMRLREGQRIRDFQTAFLGGNDRGWTTHGRREGRAGGMSAEGNIHIRYRDADADACVIVALRLEPAEEEPTLDAVAAALDHPERPLFTGRKPFLPSGRIVEGFLEAGSIREALEHIARQTDVRHETGRRRAQWPGNEGGPGSTADLTDERNWRFGVHTGLRRVIEGEVGTP